MREIKFRYVFKHTKSNKFKYLIYTLKEIEEGILIKNINLMDTIGFKLISRDEYIGFNDKEEKEIYENDYIPFLGFVEWDSKYGTWNTWRKEGESVEDFCKRHIIKGNKYLNENIKLTDDIWESYYKNN